MSDYCPNCGTKLPEGAAFCSNCGKPVFREEREPQQSAPAGTLAATNLRGAPPLEPARSSEKVIKWVLGAAAVLCMGLLGLIFLALIGFVSTGLSGLLVGMVLGTLPVPIYLALALWIDRYEREPAWMLAGTFLWGATVAVFISFIVNTLNSFIVGSAFGPAAGSIFAGSISAPVVEEGSKGLALFILYWWKKDEFDGVIDGIVYAAMVGLGFAMAENFLYYGRAFAEDGIIGSVVVFVVRGVISPFSHPLFTSMTGIGLGLARVSRSAYVKFLAPLAGLMGAIILHSLWNTAATFLPSLLGVAVLSIFLTIPVMIGVLTVVFFGLRREGRIARQYLAPELHSGLLSQQEYRSLGSVGGRLGASGRALSSGGFGAWRTRTRFDQVASELAFHRDRVRRGITSTDDAGREAAYVRLLRDSTKRAGSASSRRP